MSELTDNSETTRFTGAWQELKGWERLKEVEELSDKQKDLLKSAYEGSDEQTMEQLDYILRDAPLSEVKDFPVQTTNAGEGDWHLTLGYRTMKGDSGDSLKSHGVNILARGYIDQMLRKQNLWDKLETQNSSKDEYYSALGKAKQEYLDEFISAS